MVAKLCKKVGGGPPERIFCPQHVCVEALSWVVWPSSKAPVPARKVSDVLLMRGIPKCRAFSASHVSHGLVQVHVRVRRKLMSRQPASQASMLYPTQERRSPTAPARELARQAPARPPYHLCHRLSCSNAVWAAGGNAVLSVSETNQVLDPSCFMVEVSHQWLGSVLAFKEKLQLSGKPRCSST